MIRVDHAVSNAFVRQKDWRMALSSLDHMMEHLEETTTAELDEASRSLMLEALRVELLSRQIRILLQVGALPEAATLLDRAKASGEQPRRVAKTSASWMIQKVPAQLAVNEGLVLFAQGQHEQAMAAFKQAVDHQRELILLGDVVKYNRDNYMGSIWVDPPCAILTQGYNNMALSALYTCRMKEAVRMMETLVREDPTAYLTERLAFNLCTLYELGADATASARKKRVLQLVAKRFYLHDIGPESFRVS